MKVLSKSEWRKLDFLFLVNNEVDDVAIDTIHSANWPCLRFIDFDYNFVFFVWNSMTILGVLTLSKLKLEGIRLYHLLKAKTPKIMKQIQIIETR